MPLTSAGKDIMRNMAKEYGSQKAKSVFYAKANKDPKFARLVHRVRKRLMR